jgi:hypothetical protein
MTMAPMVLDRDPPPPAVKDAFAQFASDGYATIVADVLGRRGTYPEPQVWKGMPILELLNYPCYAKQPAEIADTMAAVIRARGNPAPGFYFFRTTWLDAGTATDALDALRQKHPQLNVEVVSPYALFTLFKQSRESGR